MTEAEIIDNLMKPRYKVIADYPGSKFSLNDIVNTFCDEKSPGRTWYIAKHEDGQKWQHGVCDKYPHLFRKLKWWEDRTPEEMPEYVKVRYADKSPEKGAGNDSIWRVCEWEKCVFETIREPQWLAYLDGYKPGYESRYGKEFGRLNACHLIPATETEYLNYQQSKA